MEDPDSVEQKATPEVNDPAAASEPVSPKVSFKRRHWGKLLLLSIVAVPVLVFTVWTTSTLGWSYSNGDRPGFVQKITKKGWLCKTWEGTLSNDIANKGFRPDSFQFSVRSDSIAHELEKLSGKKVSIHYEQHKGVPTSCFGDTEYFITGVREVKD